MRNKSAGGNRNNRNGLGLLAGRVRRVGLSDAVLRLEVVQALADGLDRVAFASAAGVTLDELHERCGAPLLEAERQELIEAPGDSWSWRGIERSKGTRRCDGCGEFRMMDVRAKYCSSSCKQTAYRRRKRQLSNANDVYYVKLRIMLSQWDSNRSTRSCMSWTSSVGGSRRPAVVAKRVGRAHGFEVAERLPLPPVESGRVLQERAESEGRSGR